MRAAVVGIGVAMLVVGGVLWYLPFPTSSSANVTVGYGYVVGTDPPLALLTSSVGYSASWTSQNTTNVSVYDCGTDSSCGSQGGQVAQGVGTHGTISWSGAKGEYFDIIPNDTAEVTVTYHTPLGGGTVGLVLVGFGAVLAVVGLRSAPPPRKPEPTTAD